MNSNRRVVAFCASALVVAACALASCSPKAAPAPLSPRDFETAWHALLAQRDYAAAQQLIDQREAQLPNDAEVLIARANLYFRQATGPTAGFGPGGRKGAAVGDSMGFDTLLAERALDTLRDGIHQHPERLDLRMGLTYLCQQMGMRIAEVQVVGETVGYTLAHADSLLWSYGEPLPAPANEYVPQVLHDYVRYYANRNAPGDDRAMLAMAQLVMRAYPNSSYVPNDVAFWYATQNHWELSLDYLRMAEHADSTDALVLYNLGWANEQLRRRDPAVRYYRRALAVGTAGSKADIVQSANQRLAALGATP